MLNAIDQALSRINARFDRLGKAAGRIARDGADGDVSRNMVELRRAAQDVRVNLATMRTADAMIGSLIDVLV